MKPVELDKVQEKINSFVNKDLYIHLETTNGAYAVHSGAAKMSAGAYIRNGLIKFTQGKITGDGSYRVGLKMELGWIYAEGITDWEYDEKGRLLLAGHDEEGRLAVALQLSPTPFE
ncbi:YojF family protein [Fredinandcohnia quinoae]|uniref:YojF family protein n=1 Tax=Fredinandcohnia quinoae TaxID=2918902 RepID=A0AAW5E513_9BACI|nr:YojF family protein [Fredinandcohnia sp. SECRCQ15]MCH1626330.1 YojF family protein [Fredinandcohnia sp. SECRCQ15]